MKRVRHNPQYDLIDILEASMQFPDSGDFAVLRKAYAKVIVANLQRFYEMESNLEILASALNNEVALPEVPLEASRELGRLRRHIEKLPHILAERLNVSADAVALAMEAKS